MVTKARVEDDVQIEGIAALHGDDTPKMENQCGENENIEQLADSLRPLKLDWNELEWDFICVHLYSSDAEISLILAQQFVMVYLYQYASLILKRENVYNKYIC